jgi:hypothetical protein
MPIFGYSVSIHKWGEAVRYKLSGIRYNPLKGGIRLTANSLRFTPPSRKGLFPDGHVLKESGEIVFFDPEAYTLWDCFF